MKTKYKRTLNAIFAIALMILCLACPEGAKAADTTTDTFECYHTTKEKEMHGEYTIEYILKNYNVFTTGDYNGNHVVGPVIVGGTFTPSSIGVGDKPYSHTVPSYIGRNPGTLNAHYNNNTLYFYANPECNTNQIWVVDIGNKVRTDAVRKTGSFIRSDVMEEIRNQILAQRQRKTIVIKANKDANLNKDHYSYETGVWGRLVRVRVQKGYQYDVSELNQLDLLDVCGGEENADVIVFNDRNKVQMPKVLFNNIEAESIETGHNTGLVFMAPNATEFHGPKNGGHTGHVVAPLAAVSIFAGNYNGCVIAKSVVRAGEGHMWPYNGTLIPDKPGTLIVTKTVQGGTVQDKHQYFEFTVTYTDKYGKIHQDEHFKLKHGDSKRFDGLLAGSKYTVAEAENNLFTQSYSNAAGIIPEGKSIEAGFTNTLKTEQKPTAVSITLTARKELDGKKPGGKKFSFTLLDANKKPIETTPNDEDGNITFKERTFDAAKEYTYYIQEANQNAEDEYIYDSSVYQATVRVRLSEDQSQYKASVTYTKNGERCEPVFKNETKTVVPEKTSVSVQKVWKGENTQGHPDSVEVQLCKNDKPYKSVQLNEGNQWKYEWTGLDAKDTWKVEELNVPENYESTSSHTGNKWTITNTLKTEQKPAAVSITLTARKELDGKKPGGKKFSFTLLDENKKPIETRRNDEDGNITFKRTFDAAKEYTYYIQEANQNAEDEYIYDSSVYQAAVTVSLSEDPSQYKASVTYTKDGEPCEPVFKNETKTVIPEKTSVSVQKVWKGENNQGHPDSVEVQLCKNDKPYKSVQLNEGNQWKYEWTGLDAKDTWKVEELNVSENYASTSSHTGNKWTITNTLKTEQKPTAASITLTARKELDGKKPAGKVFSFTLLDANKKPIETTQNDEDGNITFKERTFDAAKEYTYYIQEANQNAEDEHSYDSSVYQVTVQVRLSEDRSQYEASVTYTKDGKPCEPVFKNKTKTDAPEKMISVTAVKVWKDYDQTHRPASVQVQLYKSGMAYGKPVELNARNGWKTAWNGLDSKASWSVNELNVPAGYEKTMVQSGNDWTITNTYKAPIGEEILEDLPQTGDSSNLKLLFALGCLSLVGAAVMVSKKK